MSADDDLRFVGDQLASHARELIDENRPLPRTRDDFVRAAAVATSAKDAFEGALLAVRRVAPNEIEGALADLAEEVRAAGLAEHAATLKPADLLRAVLDHVQAARGLVASHRALEQALQPLWRRLSQTHATDQAAAAAGSEPARRRALVVGRELDEVRALLEPFGLLPDGDQDRRAA